MLKNKLSIVLLSYYSEARLAAVSKLIIQKMEEEHIPLELIIMDDGSTDGSYEKAQQLEAEDERIKAFQLSRNYTTPYAQFAGMEVATGDCIVFVPDDLQRPLGTVVQMYRAWQKGNKLVIAHRKSRDDGWLSDFNSKLYYGVMNKLSDVDFPPGGADGFLADREIIDIMVNDISPRHTSSIVEVLRLGFSPYYLPFDRPAKDGKSRWTWSKKIALAKDTFIASSSFPIRLITKLGFVVFFTSFVLGVMVLVAKLMGSDLFGFPVSGWTTLVLFTMAFNGLILLCMGIIAEYIWRIYEEVKGRPGYIIKNKDK